MNKKELQITTAMPVMKKSLLALAVAGTMAMSGGAYAALGSTTVTYADSTAAATAANTAQTTSTATAVSPDNANVTITQSNVDGQVVFTGTTATIGKVTKIQVANMTAVAAVTTSTVGAINIDTSETITIGSLDASHSATLNIGAVTGAGTLVISGVVSAASDTITVSGSTLGVSSGTPIALAEIEVVGGAGHGTNNGAAVLNASGTINTTVLTITGGTAADTDLAGYSASSVISGAATIGAGGIDVTAGASLGNGTSDVNGGAATLTFEETVSIAATGDVDVIGGAGEADAGNAGANATVTFNKNVVSAAALNLTGGGTDADGAGDAVVNIKGDASFTAIVLTDSDGAALLNINGTTAQTITGAIDAGSNDEGVITISNTHADGVTFLGSIGGTTANSDDLKTINIGTATAGSIAIFNSAVMLGGDLTIGLDTSSTGASAEGSSATFKGNVTANNIILGGSADTDIKTNNAVFSGTLTITAILKGLAEEDVNTVTITGGAENAATTVTLATAMTNNIDEINVGSYTTLQANEVLKATNTKLNSNSTLKTGAAKTHVTDIDGVTAGVGTLDINHNTTLTGNVGKTLKIGTIDIADGTTLIVAPGATGGVVDATTIVINETDDDKGLTLTASNTAGHTLTVKSAITSGAGTSSDGAGLITISNSTGTVIFDKDIGSSDKRVGKLTFGSGANNVVTAKGNLYIDAIILDDDDTLNLVATSATVSGTINAANQHDGNVVVGDNTNVSTITFDSVIGGSAAIDLFHVQEKAIANISKNVTIDTNTNNAVGLLVDEDGVLNIASASNNSVTLKIATVDEGIIDFDGAVKLTGAEFTEIEAADSLNIDGTLSTLLTGTAKTLRLDATTSIGTNANTIVNAGNQIILEGATTFGASGRVNTINIKATSDFNPDTAAVIDATGFAVTTLGNLKVALASDTGLIANGATITVIESDTNAGVTYVDTIADGTILFEDTAIIDLQNNGSDTKDLKMKVVYKTSADGVTGQNSSAIVSALTAASNANNNTEWAAIAKLTSAQTENAAEQLQPDMGAANGAALASISGANTVIAGRQANTKIAFNTQGKQSGVSTGDDANDAVVWAQIFGSTATQDKVGTIDGYDADSSGLALGWETEKSGDLIGLSVSYSNVDVDGKSATASKTDAASTQAAVYGTYGKATDWMVGYAIGSNDTSRTINFGGLNSTAKGSYDSDIFSSKVGHTFDASGSFTPKADLSWTRIMNGSYTETGAGNLGLVVGSSTNDIVTARVGVEFAQHNESNGTVTIPRFSVMAGYDLVNDGAESSVSYIGGGTAFTTKAAAPEKVSLDLGFGVDHVSDDSTVSLNFNANLRDAYESMTGDITFKSKF